MTQRNSEARADMIADRIRNRNARTGQPQYMPARKNLSTRGERGQTWRTKAHTASRLKDLAEHRERLAKASA